MNQDLILDIEAIDTIRNIIDTYNYRKIMAIPTVKNSFYFADDIKNLLNFFKDEPYNRIYFYTVAPSFYEYIQKIKDKDLSVMYRLFFKNVSIPAKEAIELFDDKTLTMLLEKSLLNIEEDYIHSLIKLIPYGNFYFITTTPFFKDVRGRVYMGGDSFLLADNVTYTFRGKHFKKALDVCTGSGIQALNMSRFSDSVTGLDINPAAVDFACKNAILNKKSNVNFILSDLYENVSDKYDLIVSNTPYCHMPEDFKHCLPAYGGKLGMEIPLKIVEGFKEYLADDGMGFVCLTSPVMNGKDLLIDELETMFSSEKFHIKLTTIQYCMSLGLADFHKECGIEYFKFYHILFEKGKKYSLEITDLSLSQKISYSYLVRVNKMLCKYYNMMDIHKDRMLSRAEKEKAKGNKEKAVEIYKRILRERPESLKAHMELGTLYMEMGLYDKAEDLFKTTLKLYPEFIDGYCRLGYFYLSGGNREKAKDHFSRALELAVKHKEGEMEKELTTVLKKLKLL